MYIERVPNRNSPPAVLLRESWRENGKTQKRTVANLSSLSDETVEAVRNALKGVGFMGHDVVNVEFLGRVDGMPETGDDDAEVG